MELTADELQDRIDRVKMMPGKVLVRKCAKPDIKDENGNVVIALLEHTKEQTEFVEVVKVGPDVEHDIKPGDICSVASWIKKPHLLRDFPEGKTWMKRPDEVHEYFVADQEIIDFVVE